MFAESASWTYFLEVSMGIPRQSPDTSASALHLSPYAPIHRPAGRLFRTGVNCEVEARDGS